MQMVQTSLVKQYKPKINYTLLRNQFLSLDSTYINCFNLSHGTYFSYIILPQCRTEPLNMNLPNKSF
jgi:hypothetical protein